MLLVTNFTTKSTGDFDPFLNTSDNLLAHENSQSTKGIKVDDIDVWDDPVNLSTLLLS